MSSPLSPTLSLKTLFFFGASCLGSLRAQQIRAITYIHIYLSHTFHIFLFYLIAPLSLFFGARQCYSPYTTFFVPVRPGADGSLTPWYGQTLMTPCLGVPCRVISWPPFPGSTTTVKSQRR